MALSTAPSRNGRPGPSCAPTRGRGRPLMVTIRKSTLMAGLLEGIALSMDAEEAAASIQTAAATGNRALVVHEAGRLGHRATAARTELRRLIADVEEPL